MSREYPVTALRAGSRASNEQARGRSHFARHDLRRKRVVFNVSSDGYRWRMSEGMRYLVAGLDTLSATTSSLGAAVTELAEEVGRTNFLLEVVASNQREIIEILSTPLATAAAEVLRRAAWAAEQGFWAEAVQDYDKAIGLDWHQPTAHFGRGLALLAQA